MLNSEFLNERAGHFAERIRREVGASRPDQIRRVLSLAMSRPASPKEVDRGVALLERLEASDHLNSETALTSFCLLALNLNEFLYLD
jgi:hypothetical protein